MAKDVAIHVFQDQRHDQDHDRNTVRNRHLQYNHEQEHQLPCHFCWSNFFKC